MKRMLQVLSILILGIVLIGVGPKATMAATQKPTIGSMSYTTAPLVIGDKENLSVNFSESTATNLNRTYWVQIYGIRNGVSYLKTAKSVTIPAGSTSINASFPMDFTNLGPFYTAVKVYSYNGGTLLNQRQGLYSDTVFGNWYININLPKNRLYKGTMTLYNAEGKAQFTASCLGLSQYNTPMTYLNGNTPTGVYSGYLAGPYTPSSSYGPNKVVVTNAISGVALTSGRTGIWIHGGDPASYSSSTYPLRPTNGCVRISNADQLLLQNNINSLISGYHNRVGYIHINEY